MVTATHYDSYAEHRRYLLILASLFAVIWIALAINPSYRHDWMLENALVVVFAVGLLLTYKKIIFSRVSYTPIFVFLVLHEVGRTTHTLRCLTITGSESSPDSREMNFSVGSGITSTG